jgi:hypothetical protein
MSAKKTPPSAAAMLADPSIPVEHRRQILKHLLMGGSDEANAAVNALFDAAANANAESLCAIKARELAALIREMQDGPLRHATFLAMLPAAEGFAPRARVLLQDGTAAFPVVADAALVPLLRCGEPVLLEAQGRALLYRDDTATETGDEARLERRIGDDRIEVTLRDLERCVFRASAALLERLDSGEVLPGATLLVCQRRGMAFDVVPDAEGASRYRFLARVPVPDIVVARDIGDPRPFIEELAEHVRMEMTDPSLGRRYRLRRAVMKLLAGVSGSGKTLSSLGLWRRLYEVMSEVTGVPVDRLPPRVLRLRMSEVLSKWLGESDKRIDRFFDEVDQLADELFVAPDGTAHELPVLVICEECDGLARARGDDAIHDRIQTTLLQRLDVTCQQLKDKLVLFLFSTNVPEIVDPAFLRRAGGTTERFGRLTRRSFLAVLHKHLRGLPVQSDNGFAPAELQRRLGADVAGWLFSANGQDRGQVELTYAGATAPVLKYRRDLLTGALVDRAVQEAAAEACRAERLGAGQPGLTAGLLIAAFERQLRSVIDQLHPHNVRNYLDLPDGVRVATVRRVEQSAVLPLQLERAVSG